MDLATALSNETTNDTSMIEQDVQDMFAFEKNISKVRFSL
jgi:hypothetical protein